MNALPEFVKGRLEELKGSCSRHGVQRLALFGSAACGTFDPSSSDLDFVVEFLPMSPARRADGYFGLLFDLERIFGRSIDLVELDAIRNDVFRRTVLESQVLVHDAA